jgi:hypothetical protein
MATLVNGNGSAVSVCCPGCWAWSDLGNSTTCKKCGTPLILADGRRVEDLTNAPAAELAGTPIHAFKRPNQMLAAPAYQGPSWIAITRWITIGYGALSVLGLLLLGLLVENANFPVANPATGRLITETIPFGLIMLIAAVLDGLIFTVFALLTKYPLMRLIIMVLTLVGAFGTLTRLGGESPEAIAGSIVSVFLDAGFVFVLLMSLLVQPVKSVR